MKKDDVDIGFPEPMASSDGTLRVVDQAEIHDARPTSSKALCNQFVVTGKLFFQAFELGPISIQANAEEPQLNTGGGRCTAWTDAGAIVVCKKLVHLGRQSGRPCELRYDSSGLECHPQPKLQMPLIDLS